MSKKQEQRAAEFSDLRPLLFSIAYRILGSVGEAEDVVQDAWPAFQAEDDVRSAKAFLSTVVTRNAINTLNSARVRRETYVGQWLPEPLLEDPYQDPQRSAELADSISMAALLLLERLSPLERAAYVLREVFGYSYAEIAQLLERGESACRQLVARARQHMAAGRIRFDADRQHRDELAERFFDAVQAGDVDGLRQLLTADAQFTADGGGRVANLKRAVVGPDPIARLVLAAYGDLWELGARLEVRSINRQQGGILRDRQGRVITVIVLEVADGQVQAVRAINNPDKLEHLGEAAPAEALGQELRRLRRQRREG
ncbi:MAG: RNA polymerase sigma-70 factor [Cumulibacter sp.]